MSSYSVFVQYKETEQMAAGRKPAFMFLRWNRGWMWSLKSGGKEGMQPETDGKCVICLRLSQSIKQCVSVCVLCDFVEYFGRNRLNKKWNDKAGVPYLLHRGHLKAERRGNVCACALLLCVYAQELYTKCLWFLLLLYLFIHLFICSLVSGITSELWNSPLSLLK